MSTTVLSQSPITGDFNSSISVSHHRWVQQFYLSLLSQVSTTVLSQSPITGEYNSSISVSYHRWVQQFYLSLLSQVSTIVLSQSPITGEYNCSTSVSYQSHWEVQPHSSFFIWEPNLGCNGLIWTVHFSSYETGIPIVLCQVAWFATYMMFLVRYCTFLKSFILFSRFNWEGLFIGVLKYWV